MIPVTKQPLPLDRPLYYAQELQSFSHTYENGGMMVHGNNLSVASIPIEDVVAYLSNEVDQLRREIKTLREETSNANTNRK